MNKSNTLTKLIKFYPQKRVFKNVLKVREKISQVKIKFTPHHTRFQNVFSVIIKG